MRACLIASAFVAALAAVPAIAADPPLVPIAPEKATAPSILTPLAGDSPWTARFEAAADELLPALRSMDESRWGPLLGGRWLAAPDRARVTALLRDRDSPFRHALFAQGVTHRAILGWQPPATLTAEDRAAIAARPEAEAIVCWSSDADASWPTTAAEADNAPGRRYACARITYSIRGETPRWRAFVEREPA
ncbi:hypothetical protein CVO77_18050 [Sphingopyxis lindanitolerans]|uniref:Secreted protein n=1 Tax=Sphingopyxis lindanitolerans TaxID=2054227 RepID=A0A2S8B392_9SPHN|nr:hypothetical protein [Sphingopyxis lindanitolerans]PQM26881.1 hypothetical protein CVO77_18050 [Sphingopyxis lindanitolerans]